MKIMSTAALTLLLVQGVSAQDTAPRKPPSQPVTVDITAPTMVKALIQFTQQSGLQLIFPTDEQTASIRAPRLTGTFTPQAALQKLLEGSGLRYEFINDRTVSIQAAKEGDASVMGPAGQMRVAAVSPAAATDTTDETSVAEEQSEDTRGIPEILVSGTRTFNTDIRRTEDDIQPYVVFDAREIEHSMAATLSEFLSMNLTMNTATTSNAQQPQVAATFGDRSTITLRGLKEAETLILVNGRRMPGFAFGSSAPGQTDINSIPLSTVARIEVLPSTAGGIYGGGATGGVINIILRDDYRGMQVEYNYQTPFDTDAANKRLGLNGGFSFGGGRSRLNFSLSQTEANPLTVGERDFLRRARALAIENNPASVYGSATPPMGATTNIRSTNGQPLVLKAGNVSLGHAYTYVPAGYAGPQSDQGMALLANAGQYNLDIPVGVTGLDRPLVMTPDRRAATLGLRHMLNNRVELFLDGNYSLTDSVYLVSRFPTSAITLQPTAPNNPFTTAIRVSFPAADFDYGLEQLQKSWVTSLAAGAMVRLPKRWSLMGEIQWAESVRDPKTVSRSTLSTISTALSNGTLDVMRDTAVYPLDYSAYYFEPIPNEYFIMPYASQNHSFTLRVAGPLTDLGAGPVMLSSSLSRHKATMEESLRAFSTVQDTVRYAYSPERDSTADSYYLEITAPLFSPKRALPLVRGLDLQMSYRHDRTRTTTTANVAQSAIGLDHPDDPLPEITYRTTGVDADQYTLGLRYTPIDSLSLRVSYGAGVLPPNITQLTPAFVDNYPVFNLTDPKRNNEPITSIPRYSSLGYPGLVPEKSSSWSAGLVFKPKSLPGLRTSVDYTVIDKINELALMIDAQWLLEMADYYPDRVVRNPLTDADRALGYEVGTVQELYVGYVNYAKTRAESYDFKVSYTWDTPIGGFMANVRATWQPHLIIQAQPTSPVVEYSGFSSMLKWRGSAGLLWERGPWTAAWNTQYYNHYFAFGATSTQATRDSTVLLQGTDIIPSQIYHDASVKYKFGVNHTSLRGIFRNSEVMVGVSNVFNTSPPIIAGTALTTSGYSSLGNPMLRRYTIMVRKAFE